MEGSRLEDRGHRAGIKYQNRKCDEELGEVGQRWLRYCEGLYLEFECGASPFY